MNLYESIVNNAVELSESSIKQEIEKAIFLYLDANEIDVVPVNDIVEYSKGKFNYDDVVKAVKDLEAQGKVSFNKNNELITRIIKDAEQPLKKEDTDIIEDLQKQINNWIYEINGLVRTAKQLGNKNPYDNFMIKDRIKIVEKLKRELEEYKKSMAPRNYEDEITKEALNEATDNTDKYAKFKEFADSIDLTPLYDKLKQMSGISNIEFTSKVIERPGDVYIDIKSNSLIDACGLFKLALTDCHMETFNSGIVTSKDTNEPYWWGTMDLRFQTKQSGTNGVRFLRFSYNEEPNKWMFNEED